jgi:hypothetical protein
VYCRKCKYDLRRSVRQQRCPECGRPFDPRDRRTYRLYIDSRKIRLDKATLVLQSMIIGWCAGLALLVGNAGLPSLRALVISLVFGSFLGVMILPCWWFLRPELRNWWYWLRSPRPGGPGDEA